MPETIPESLQRKIEERLRYYEDLGIQLFYRDRIGAPAVEKQPLPPSIPEPPARPEPAKISLPPQKPQTAPASPVKTTVAPAASVIPAIAPSGPSLFASVEKIPNDTLLKIVEDIGPACTRCKLHQGRNKIVFADGSPNAQLVFIGEGPGADEDMQGLPFVGRAGKLLTQMIEAMGLQRKDVYICNVVKCRPPQNRAPEPDEVEACSPYLLRQIDVINPKVLVCLGAVAAKTLLETNRGITQFRGQWMEWRGRKLMATYHPAYLLRNPAAKGEVWKDLQKVMAELGLEVPKKKPS
jgi:uracil-DNA glycosylase